MASSDDDGIEEFVQDVVPEKKVQSRDLKSGRLLGKGSSSIVYETTWKGESYARKDFLRVPSDIFEREAAVLVGLDHPNIVRTYCWTVDEGSCSLVLELLDDDLLNMMQKRTDSLRKKFSGSGPRDGASRTSHLIDLHKFIEEGKNAAAGTANSVESVATPLVHRFSMPEALQIMLQIAQGIEYLHENGVAHGDLKPKNILVTPSGRAISGSLDPNVAFEVKVADFGLVGTKMKSRTLVSRQTRNLEMVRWRAPELFDLSFLRKDKHESSTDSDWDSDSSDKNTGFRIHKSTYGKLVRADVYSFALICSRVLTGEDPYPGLGLIDLVKKIPCGLRPRLPHTCPPQLSVLLNRCWGEEMKRPSFYGILSQLKDLQASLSADILVDAKKTITEPSLEPTESLETFASVDFTVSGQSSGRPGGSSKKLPGSETNQDVNVPMEHEKHLIKNIQESSFLFVPPPTTDNSNATSALKPRRRRKAFSFLGSLVCIPGNARNKKNPVMLKPFPSNVFEWYIPGAWKSMEDGAAPNLKGARWFSFDDIKRMTNNFNDENVLGEGGYGKVYKGIQAGTGATVAVKRAQKGSKQGAQEFKTEIELLSRVHHNNLVGLVGFCFEKSEQMLVYEYLPNGTLTDCLRGSRSDPPLDWVRRLLIALGAARGLAYLHDNADPPIIHRDVKSCNILLDKKLNAKVAGFGLSQLVPDERDGSLKKTIKGTMGYLDPEYYMTSVLTTKSDVYSFGVVLLELLTGRPPISHGGHIVREVRNKLDRAGMVGVLELLDPALAGASQEELETFLKIALVCVEDTSLERPSMHEVVKQLEALVGPKAQLMQGSESSIQSKMNKRERRVPLETSSLVSDDFEPASGQFSPGASGSHEQSFKYSGGFAPLPVQPT